MASGDITWFDECASLDYFAGWAASDDIKLAILDNTTTPAAGDATPALGDYTEVGTAGSYAAGGVSVGTWGDIWSQTGGAGLMDSATNPSWTANGSNDTDAYWGLLYNDTQAGDPAFLFIDLGGPLDMASAPTTVTWNGSGIVTLAK